MSSNKNCPTFEIIIDTREKKPWEFPLDKKIENIVSSKLDTGDYTISGLEHLLCIDRKMSTSEIAKNIIEDRFVRELERMMDFKYRYLILEFDWDEIARYPYNLKIPQWKKDRIKIRGGFIRAKLLSYQIDYGINIITCKNRQQATNIALEIMKKVAAKECQF